VIGAGSGVGALAVVDMQGRKKTLTGLWLGQTAGLAWSRKNDAVIFAAAPYTLTTSLYAVDLSGHQRLIANLSGDFLVQDVSPDGRILTCRIQNSNALLFQRIGETKEVDLYWHDFSELRDVSRDGSFVMFDEGADAARNGEDYVTYIRRTDGSPAVRLGRGYPLELSPDGKWAMVLGSIEMPSQIVLLPTGAGQARTITADHVHHHGAAWTPDGKHIVFVGNEPGRRVRYYVQDLNGGAPRAISGENVSYNPIDPVVISPDGGHVAVTNLDGNMVLTPIGGGAPRTIPKLEQGFAPLRWCPDRSLLVYRDDPLSIKILRIEVETGERALWREISPAYRTGLSAFSLIRVAADCKSSAYAAGYGPADLWIVNGAR
jgi:Tol biopolymer transport system component